MTQFSSEEHWGKGKAAGGLVASEHTGSEYADTGSEYGGGGGTDSEYEYGEEEDGEYSCAGDDEGNWTGREGDDWGGKDVGGGAGAGYGAGSGYGTGAESVYDSDASIGTDASGAESGAEDDAAAPAVSAAAPTAPTAVSNPGGGYFTLQQPPNRPSDSSSKRCIVRLHSSKSDIIPYRHAIEIAGLGVESPSGIVDLKRFKATVLSKAHGIITEGLLSRSGQFIWEFEPNPSQGYKHQYYALISFGPLYGLEEIGVRLSMSAEALKANRLTVARPTLPGEKQKRKKNTDDPHNIKAKIVNLLEEQMTPEEKALLSAQRRRKAYVEALQGAVVAAAIAAMEASDLAQDAILAAERANVERMAKTGDIVNAHEAAKELMEGQMKASLPQPYVKHDVTKKTERDDEVLPAALKWLGLDQSAPRDLPSGCGVGQGVLEFAKLEAIFDKGFDGKGEKLETRMLTKTYAELEELSACTSEEDHKTIVDFMEEKVEGKAAVTTQTTFPARRHQQSKLEAHKMQEWLTNWIMALNKQKGDPRTNRAWLLFVQDVTIDRNLSRCYLDDDLYLLRHALENVNRRMRSQLNIAAKFIQSFLAKRPLEIKGAKHQVLYWTALHCAALHCTALDYDALCLSRTHSIPILCTVGDSSHGWGVCLHRQDLQQQELVS
jgi:hypothetical protein